MMVTKGTVEAGISGKFGDRNHLAAMFVMTGKTSEPIVEGSYRMKSDHSFVSIHFLSSVLVAVR